MNYQAEQIEKTLQSLTGGRCTRYRGIGAADFSLQTEYQFRNLNFAYGTGIGLMCE